MSDWQQLSGSKTDSQLLQLPTELRLKIVRMLVKSPGILWCERGYRPKREYAGSLQLSGQLLSVCRTLKAEAESVLYGENVLSVYCEEQWLTGADRNYIEHTRFIYYNILNARVASRTEARDFDSTDCGIDALARSKEVYVGDDVFPHKSEADRMEVLHKSIMRFRNLHIRFSPIDRESLYISCRVLQRLVDQKNVQVSAQFLEETDTEYSGWHRTFMPWRCQLIDFQGCDKEKTQAVVRIITSKTPFESSLLSEWCKVKRDIVGKLRCIDDTYFQRPNWETLDEFDDALYNHDVSEFMRLKKKICDNAAGWNLRWASYAARRELTEFDSLVEIEMMKNKMAKTIAEVSGTNIG